MQITPQPPVVGVDVLSLSVARLEMVREDTVLAVGSGFLWLTDNTLYLVTAWHNLTGTHPTTGKPISAQGGRPNRVKAYLRTEHSQQEVILFSDLYNHNDQTAVWYVHPSVGELVDIAVVPFPFHLPANCAARPINQIEQHPILTPVGSDAFIVGYPLGISENGFPIWKRASLASEPKVFADQPMRRRLIVDSATRAGLSGAPVIARSVGSYLGENGTLTVGMGISTRFIGLYSGRLAAKDALDAQLGIVWPAPLIERIIQARVLDTFEEYGAFTPRDPLQ